jgi:hypothetical protein
VARPEIREIRTQDLAEEMTAQLTTAGAIES